MASYVKYNKFVENLCSGEIDIIGATDTLKACIHTDAPVPTTDSAFANLTEIAGSNGYTTGGEALSYTCSEASGTVTLAPTADILWTASGGNLGATADGRYFSIYDDTSAGNYLICSFDYGATFTVASGETMTLDFGATLATLV